MAVAYAGIISIAALIAYHSVIATHLDDLESFTSLALAVRY